MRITVAAAFAATATALSPLPLARSHCAVVRSFHAPGAREHVDYEIGEGDAVPLAQPLVPLIDGRWPGKNQVWQGQASPR